MKLKFYLIFNLFVMFFSSQLAALQERHLVIIRHGECEHSLAPQYNSNPKHPRYVPAYLSEKGQDEAKQTADILIHHGFDNRSIKTVYVSPLPRALQTAQILSEIGIFTKEKIMIDPRLIESQAGEREGLLKAKFSKDPWFVGIQEAKSYQGESNEDVRKRVLAIYDEAEEKTTEGHIIFITHGIPAMELIDALTKRKEQLKTGQMYLVPLMNRNSLV